MADLYDTLNATAQANVRAKLYAVVTSKPCPNVDVSGIASADALTDAGSRGVAVDCFQQARGLTSSVAGVFDQATYTALVGWWPALPMGGKVLVAAGGVAVFGTGFYFATRKKRPRRLAR
jgi:hypothetical protein